MKKILVIIYIVLILILLKCVSTYFLNEYYINKYETGDYEEASFEKLFFLNIQESYIAHYNRGNVLYEDKEYDDAIEEYEKALKLCKSKKRECNIRINLALAKIAKIDEDYASEENKDKTLSILSDAKNVLCENGCANRDDDNGHSRTAEKLKSDIERIEKELKEEEEKDKSESNKENNKDEKESKDIKTKKEQLKEIQSKTLNERNDEIMQSMQSIEDIHYGGRNW